MKCGILKSDAFVDLLLHQNYKFRLKKFPFLSPKRKSIKPFIIGKPSFFGNCKVRTFSLHYFGFEVLSFYNPFLNPAKEDDLLCQLLLLRKKYSKNRN